MFSAELERKDPKDYSGIVAYVTRKWLEAASATVLSAAKLNLTQNQSVDTGNLRSSLTRKTFEQHAEVGTNVDYGEWVEYGTKPHLIPGPVNIPGIGWRRNVHHPGSRPKPYLRPAIDENRSALTRMFGQLIREEMAK